MNFGLILEKRILPYVIIYIVSLILIYVAILLYKSIENTFVVSLIGSAFVIVIILVFVLFQRLTRIPLSLSGQIATRYTMLCHSCGWEWISHTTDKDSPNKCPNCGEKSRLELIGWRKVNISPKSAHKTLKSFFK